MKPSDETHICRSLTDGQMADVDSLLSQADAGQLLGYHLPAYQSRMEPILGDEGRHLLSYTDGALTGYLPYREKTGPLGTVVNAMPFFGANSLIAARDAVSTARLIQAFRQVTARAEVASVVIYTPFLAEAGVVAESFAPQRRIQKFTQYLDLADWQGWPKKRRGDLKRAEAAGFAVRDAVPGDVQPLYEIYRENCREAGIPEKPRSYIEMTLGLAAERPHRTYAALGTAPIWLVAELQGEIVAGLLAMCGPKTASYTMPIALAHVRPQQPVAFLIDAAVQKFKAAGGRYWNFESSPSWGDAVFKFKERWGALTSTYEILVAYPNGEERLAGTSPALCREAYPYYFVRPFEVLSGQYPAAAEPDRQTP